MIKYSCKGDKVKPLIYALIIIMIIDAFLLAFFIIRTVQKKRLKKNEKLPTKVETKVDNKDNNEKKGKQEKPVSQNKKKKKNKLTKHSSFGKIYVNEEALKKILAGYDEEDKKKEETITPSEKVNEVEEKKVEENLDAVFEDFKIAEPVKEEKKPQTPRFHSPFHNILNERRVQPVREVKEEEEIEEDDDDDDFDTSDIEKAYQDFLMRKKQEYLKKYEEDVDIGDEGEEAREEVDKKYTLDDFKKDYFTNHKDISEIVEKLSDEDKNKILSILLRKNTIEESDFDS